MASGDAECESGVVPSENWVWSLGALIVWVGIFFAFLLISMA
jgi:hypothetical protein